MTIGIGPNLVRLDKGATVVEFTTTNDRLSLMTDSGKGSVQHWLFDSMEIEALRSLLKRRFDRFGVPKKARN
jgi:hypothetical protein